MFEGEVQFVGAGSGICFLPDEGGGSTEGVDEAGMVADPEPDWTGWLRTDGGGGRAEDMEGRSGLTFLLR